MKHRQQHPRADLPRVLDVGGVVPRVVRGNEQVFRLVDVLPVERHPALRSEPQDEHEDGRGRDADHGVRLGRLLRRARGEGRRRATLPELKRGPQPQTLGVPPPPQVSGEVQSPHGSVALHPSLMVPQSFRYEELPSGSTEEQLFASARTVSAAQEGSVVVLDIPATPIELVPGLQVNPTTLIVALSQYGNLYLSLEPASGFEAPDILTLNLADLYDAMNEDRGGK